MTRDRDGSTIMGPGWAERRDIRAEERVRWERRAAQWAALDLARAVFGEETELHLAPYPGRGGIRGLLSVEVPFRGLEEHRERERIFLELAWRDPVLRAVPVLFAFEFSVPFSSPGAST